MSPYAQGNCLVMIGVDLMKKLSRWAVFGFSMARAHIGAFPGYIKIPDHSVVVARAEAVKTWVEK